MFTDSIQGNFDLAGEIISDAPPTMKDQAKRTAILMENAYLAILKDNPKCMGTRIGLTFAVLLMAQRLTEGVKSGEDKQLLQLLS